MQNGRGLLLSELLQIIFLPYTDNVNLYSVAVAARDKFTLPIIKVGYKTKFKIRGKHGPQFARFLTRNWLTKYSNEKSNSKPQR